MKPQMAGLCHSHDYLHFEVQWSYVPLNYADVNFSGPPYECKFSEVIQGTHLSTSALKNLYLQFCPGSTLYWLDYQNPNELKAAFATVGLFLLYGVNMYYYYHAIDEETLATFLNPS